MPTLGVDFAFLVKLTMILDGSIWQMIEFRYSGNELYARMERAVERVLQRLRTTVNTLESAGIPYAVVGGHAVRAWVTQVDEAAVRNTRDVDILIRPADLPRVIAAMTAAGFHHRQAAGLNTFVESEDASARDRVHVVLAGEKVRPDDYEPNPDIEPSTTTSEFRTLPLETLVRMKLISHRLKDQVHIQDMISVGLIDESWLARLTPELQPRLKVLLDNPDR